MDSCESSPGPPAGPRAPWGESESRFAEIRAARERRSGARGTTERDRAYDTPPYDNFPMEDTAPPAKGSLVRVAATRAAVCALLLGALFAAQNMMPNTYRQLRASYTLVMKTDMS
ncbi:MAG: hypothetical protein LBB75_01205, partial [Oscillospiraceae bacterium]|nr:hypothetical protein [Oscillospiraceae bacterium]